ncbi:MAG: nickel pincer cofactor biosynthesis protein LarC [Candidatus Omnitrophica bacterium]|nr:nickel pincer cofactor biosynthesis protein LarC [Candidatus Omnitrophota bacterium]
MRIALIDGTNGVSADMILGAFLDAGVKLSDLRKALAAVKIGRYAITAKQQTVNSFRGVAFRVAYKKRDYVHIHYSFIRTLIKKSRLKSRVKQRALKIFDIIATAEARAHGIPKSKVTFHEVGAIDSLVDVIGVSWCFEHLKIKKAFAVNLSDGHGAIRHRGHGRMPVPSTATLEILKGTWLCRSKIRGELITPTGAAIIKACCETDVAPLSYIIDTIGYGVGSRRYADHQSMLRLAVGESSQRLLEERIVALETNIDDMSPQAYQGLNEKLFKAGALDVFAVPVFMKKQRPAFMLVVLLPHHIKEKIAAVVFEETTAFGMRFSEMDRYILERRFSTIKTKYGQVKVKIGTFYGVDRVIAPEFEDVKRLAARGRRSFKEVHRACMNAVRKMC